jgi:MYXO-CTERM domain-containing protein
MKTIAIAILGTSSIIASADAGFMGFVALAKQSGSYVFVDVYTAVGNASDKFLNVYETNISTTNVGGFYQQPGLATKTWKPDAANFNSTRSSVDSFMTAGTYSGGAQYGIWCSHLVLANATLANLQIYYSAVAPTRDGVSNTTDSRRGTLIIPAPGAIALLGVGGIAVRRRRG